MSTEHSEDDAGAYTLTRWMGYERCPNSDALHVLPMYISSSVRLFAVETPGNITAAEPCPFCCPIPSANGVERPES